jgi:hypothetical protein
MSREKDDIKRLVKADNHIQKIVGEYGLDCFPQEFDVIPAQKMLEIMSYNLPVNYSHWSFGRDYEKQRTQYEYSGGIPYEVVLNSNPSRAFLMKTNPYPIQVLVMAHVYGHNDFMKNNIYFGRTRRDMLTSASESAGRLRKYEEDYGIDEVERLIDAAQAIQMHIEADLFQESAIQPSEDPKRRPPKVGAAERGSQAPSPEGGRALRRPFRLRRPADQQDVRGKARRGQEGQEEDPGRTGRGHDGVHHEVFPPRFRGVGAGRPERDPRAVHLFHAAAQDQGYERGLGLLLAHAPHVQAFPGRIPHPRRARLL